MRRLGVCPSGMRDRLLVCVFDIAQKVVIATSLRSCNLSVEKVAESCFSSSVFLCEMWAMLTDVFMPFELIPVLDILGNVCLLNPCDRTCERHIRCRVDCLVDIDIESPVCEVLHYLCKLSLVSFRIPVYRFLLDFF